MALVAWRTHRPARAVLMPRRGGVRLARTRHPIPHRPCDAGFGEDGTPSGPSTYGALTNTGAYGSHALTVVCNCGSKVLPLYRCPTCASRAKAVYTNLPVGGAYRGYGATQAAFAMECSWTRWPRDSGIDPVELRRRCHIRDGRELAGVRGAGRGAGGGASRRSARGLAECLERGAQAIGWSGEARAAAAPGRDPGPACCAGWACAP